MPNTFNLSLSSFFSTPISQTNLVEGVDFVIDDKNLYIPSNSNLLSRINTITTTSTGLSTFYGNNLTNLSAINIVSPNLQTFTSPPNLSILSAVNIGVTDLALSGNRFTSIEVLSSPNLRTIDLLGVRDSVGPTLRLTSNTSLSAINTRTNTVSSLSTVVFTRNNLNATTIDTIFTALSASYSNRSFISLSANLSFFVANPTLGNSGGLTFFTMRLAASGTFVSLSSTNLLISQLT